MRVLIGPDGDGSDEHLRRLYAPDRSPWLRANMVTTVDGAATGDSGTSSSINNPVDKRVFDTLRGLADAILVGAGTARTEGYGPADVPIVLVSRSGEVPEGLRGAKPGRVLMATVASSPGLGDACVALGDDHVIVTGESEVDLRVLLEDLRGRGLDHVLSEGGPSLLAALLDQGLVDELDATVAPRLVSGDHPRIVSGPPVDVPLELATLLEDDGTLLARWLVTRED